jgi:hypothetical protein
VLAVAAGEDQPHADVLQVFCEDAEQRYRACLVGLRVAGSVELDRRVAHTVCDQLRLELLHDLGLMREHDHLVAAEPRKNVSVPEHAVRRSCRCGQLNTRILLDVLHAE